MTIPTKAILSLDSVSPSISTRLPATMSIHGLLAAQLAASDDAQITLRKDTMPMVQSFTESTPIFWVPELQQYLPEGAKKLVAKQAVSFRRDWDAFTQGFPGISRQDYLHCWFLVGTRAFYNETDRTLRYPWEDRLALLPVADMFNHADVPGCTVAFSAESYTVTARQSYQEGDEVHISYGEHSNDFLLAEYGFIMDGNQWDSVHLGELMLSKLETRDQEALREQGLDNLTLSPKSGLDDASEDGQGASLRRFMDQHMLLAATRGNAAGQMEYRGAFAVVLAEILHDIRQIKADVQLAQIASEAQKTLLLRRWSQIEAMIEQQGIKQP
jgi:hypothetical protein